MRSTLHKAHESCIVSFKFIFYAMDLSQKFELIQNDKWSSSLK